MERGGPGCLVAGGGHRVLRLEAQLVMQSLSEAVAPVRAGL